MLSVNIGDIAVITVKNADYRCIIHKIGKSEAINLLESFVLKDRGYTYKKYCLNFQSTQGSFFYFFVLVYIKWVIVNMAWTSINL